MNMGKKKLKSITQCLFYVNVPAEMRAAIFLTVFIFNLAFRLPHIALVSESVSFREPSACSFCLHSQAISVSTPFRQTLRHSSSILRWRTVKSQTYKNWCVCEVEVWRIVRKEMRATGCEKGRARMIPEKWQKSIYCFLCFNLKNHFSVKR